MKKLLTMILKLGFLQGHRRQIGLGAIVIGAVIEALTQADMLAAFPWLSMHATTLMAIGGYVALVGAAYKDDPKTAKTEG